MSEVRKDRTADIVAIDQLIMNYWYEIDFNQGRSVADHWVDGGAFVLGSMVSVAGRANLKAYYEEWARQVALTKDVRTSRHTSTGHRHVFDGDDRATVTFLAYAFSGAGEPPLFNATAPTIISDSRVQFRRDGEGEWRFFDFHAEPVFVGDDPFLNEQVVTG
jgi:hypothetical protein